MKILVFGHDLIHKSSRIFWKELASLDKSNVIDLMFPRRWKSDFIKYTTYQYDSTVDGLFNKIVTAGTIGNRDPDHYVFCGIKLWLLLTFNKYDAIIIRQKSIARVFFQLTLIKIFTRNRKTKCYLITSNNVKERLGMFQKFRERFSMKHVEVVLCPSKEVKNVLERKNISKECRYFPFSYDQKLLGEVPLNFNQSEIFIGFIGKLSEEKGIRLLLEACSNLKKSGYKIRLAISGSGELERMLKSNLEIDFLGRFRDDEVAEFYRRVDIVVLPAITTDFWKEQTSKIIIEAVASGKLVIGSSSSLIPEIMRQLNMPYVFQENSLHDLTSKISMAIADIASGNAYKMAVVAKDSCQQLFSHEASAARLQQYLHSESDIGLL
ncbi:MAG: hypothetical protein A2504_04300 [Bdellovibrionales bacterium RIFOXYD12_FULL_39_22]|nr:MAG: hypothetical protein A2385_07525 [Bdellovibrionales bacterium RIFOXYB1_FULL_39_21]OFZ42109.1 MAG: hypothetical protein A2485_09495 [Bdellovibrionales bacterium RIFOXYC12_FULL_39_17]OFZ50825.1 MAG: hypothetical protein A2404_06445 [Bdellovibrionales bacterium RIFOXYC1_FULL_39_130]OFZ78048.1 MAG: hypothetical protein A2560_01615 [Bdellovibrionales bacterium RIFOXYD1_FULL_39_84]OFZ93516.1 MAG: hypothetical protein A2504_04300 [Bdellovibrionales bacterium RIFOXYD12_FULL_39_22]HLE10363.1 gl